MKIFCVGRNYGEHVKELNNAMPEAPVIFMKPSTALLKDNKPFYLPDFSKDMHYETELVFRICKNGKHVNEKFGMQYVDAVTVGIDFTARDVQSEQKKKGLPWEIAKAFDNSAVIGEWKMLYPQTDISAINFSMMRNKEWAQKANAGSMIYNVPYLISYLSEYFTLQKGDLLFTGTPAGVAAVQVGDKLEGFIEDERLFSFEVK